jgi:hypothetical protein
MWCTRLDRGRKETKTMKTFILDADHNITTYASQEAASNAVPPGDAFTTVAGLKTALKQLSAATVVGIWNSLTGVTPVKKFASLDVAAKRIFNELQKLGGPDAATEAAAAEPAKRAPKAAKKHIDLLVKQRDTKTKANVAKPATTKKAPKPAGSGPRETSKTAQLIEMLKRPKGATLEEVMAKFGWQVHTTRALMSAGGSLTKKHGLTVISEKVGDSRTYRLCNAPHNR